VADLFEPDEASVFAADTPAEDSAQWAPLPNEAPSATEPELSYQNALALYERGAYAEAIEQLEALLSTQERLEPELIHLLARAYANQGRLNDALAWCEKGLVADKLSIGLHYLRAGILQSLEQADAAAATLGRTLYLEPDFILGHYSLGNLLRRQGRFKEANKHFKNALALLQRQPIEKSLPESEGLTAGRLIEIIRTTIANLEPANENITRN